MSNKSKPEKQNHKTRQEILNERILEEKKKEQTERANILRKEIKEKIYPTLLKANSIKDVKDICKVFMSYIQQAVNEVTMKLVTSDLRINGKTIDQCFSEDDANYSKYKVLFEAVKDKNYLDTYAMVTGFENAVGAALQQEEKKRKLADLMDFEKNFE